MAAMGPVAEEDGADQVLLFVVDILNEEATLLVPNDTVKTVAEKSFGALGQRRYRCPSWDRQPQETDHSEPHPLILQHGRSLPSPSGIA